MNVPWLGEKELLVSSKYMAITSGLPATDCNKHRSVGAAGTYMAVTVDFSQSSCYAMPFELGLDLSNPGQRFLSSLSTGRRERG